MGCMQEQASSAAARRRLARQHGRSTGSRWSLAAALPLLLVPATAAGAEFCAAPAAPPGWRSAGRVFHGTPRILSLRIGDAAPIPCRAIPDQPAATCGAYRLSYAPWDLFPELARLNLQGSTNSRKAPWTTEAKALSATVLSCRPLPRWRDEDGGLRLQVLSQRELRARFPAPLGLVVIRESFLSHHPLVSEGSSPAAGRQP